MAGEHFPTEVELLLREDVETYEQLEALLALVSRSERPHTAAELAAAAGLDEESAAEALAHLRLRGLAIAEKSAEGVERYRFAAGSTGRDAAARALARIYAERPAEVARRMAANAIERLRTQALRTFSDAFLFRRSKQDDG